MNDQQIIDFVRATGRARIVQVSDKFDVTPQDAADRLRELAAAGQLKESSGFAPNGLKCPIFDVPDAAPVISASGFPIPATRVNAQPPVAAQEEVEESTSTRTPEPDADAPADGPKLTKADQAIAFIRERGEATASELHSLLGLKPEEYPSSYLGHALKDGRLVRDGKIWKLGDGTPMAPAPKARSLRDQPAVPRKDAEPAAQFVTTGTMKTASILIESCENIAASQPEQAELAAPAFRVGVWSDGVIELQRGGLTVVTINQSEREQLLTFLECAKVPKAA